MDSRRTELRRVAKSRIEAIERHAVTEIQSRSIEGQTRLALAGLTTEGAKAFLTDLPTIETLMPGLSYEAIAGEAEPSPIEQLLTPNALRQRRYRDRQRTLRNAAVTPTPALPNASDEEDDGS